MSDPIVTHETKATDWERVEVAYSYEDLLETWTEDAPGVVRPLVLRCQALEAERDEAFALVTSALEDRPMSNGEYAHLGYCSGSRQQPAGTPGISCCCHPLRRQAEAEVARLTAELQKMAAERDGLAERLRK
jgi:hypothetical protein